MNGIQIDMQLAILKAYLHTNRKPKIVIQNLESFSFEATRPGEIYDPGLYLPYLHIQPLYDDMVKIDPAVKKWRYIPLYGYTVEDMRFTWTWGFLRHVGVQVSQDYHLGFNPRFQVWNDDFTQFRAGVQKNGVQYKIEPQGVHALSQILSLCRAQGIICVLAYSPVFGEMQKLERNRSEIFGLFQSLAQEHGAYFWDFSDSPLCASTDFFYNSQHLNAQGANIFSRQVAVKVAELKDKIE